MQAITSTYAAGAVPATSVLIVEDDPTLNELLCRQLQQRGYQVDNCTDGDAALLQLGRNEYDLVLLDWMLPGCDGIHLLKELRKRRQTPVIMLTACGAEEERIEGLRVGADDYLTKPFNITELMLRIDGLLRRSRVMQPTGSAELCFQDLVLNTQLSSLLWQGTPVELTPTEFSILHQLIARQGQVLGKPELYQEVMGRPWSRYDRSLDMHISKLRRKLNAVGFDARQLQTVHGQGYRLK